MNIIAARGIHLAPPSLFERVRTKLAQAAARRPLGELDDRLLRDLGISRADIEFRGLLE